MFNLYYISGNIFKEFKYTNSDNLIETLNEMLEEYSYNYQFIQLILNDDIINYYYINNLNKDSLETDFVKVIFIDKRNLFCLGETNGKYILNTDYKHNITKYPYFQDTYYNILCQIISYYENSYTIIMNSTYRELIILMIKKNGIVIESLGVDMQNDKELVYIFVFENTNTRNSVFYIIY